MPELNDAVSRAKGRGDIIKQIRSAPDCHGCRMMNMYSDRYNKCGRHRGS